MSHSSDLALPRWTASTPAAATLVGTATTVVSSCQLPRPNAAHSRRRATVIAAIVSVAIHVGVLFAFNGKPAARSLAAPEVPPASIVALAFDLPPPEPPPSEEVVADEPEAAESGFDSAGLASLPEPLSSVAVADITVVVRPTIPVAPSALATRWAVPTSQLRTTPPPSAQVFKVGELDRRPVLVSSVEPVFPAELSTSTVEGVVVVSFIVNTRGEIEAARVVSAPHPLLGTAVTKALARWQFRAGMKNGRNVSTEMELPVRFNLAGT